MSHLSNLCLNDTSHSRPISTTSNGFRVVVPEHLHQTLNSNLPYYLFVQIFRPHKISLLQEMYAERLVNKSSIVWAVLFFPKKVLKIHLVKYGYEKKYLLPANAWYHPRKITPCTDSFSSTYNQEALNQTRTTSAEKCLREACSRQPQNF